MAKSFPLNNQMILVSSEAPGGLYNPDQLKELAEVCQSGIAIAKITEDQRISLFLKEEMFEDVRDKLEQVGLGVRHYGNGLHQPISCLGAHCPKHEQDALATSVEVSKALGEIVSDAPIRIGINGCSACCVPTHTLDVSVIGEASGYRISLGGKNSHMPEIAVFAAEGVPGKELPDLLHKVVQAYQDQATDNETLQEVIERCGMTSFIEALAPYSQDAASVEDNPFGPLDEPSLEEKQVNNKDDDNGHSEDFGELDTSDIPEVSNLDPEHHVVEADNIAEDDNEKELVGEQPSPDASEASEKTQAEISDASGEQDILLVEDSGTALTCAPHLEEPISEDSSQDPDISFSDSDDTGDIQDEISIGNSTEPSLADEVCINSDEDSLLNEIIEPDDDQLESFDENLELSDNSEGVGLKMETDDDLNLEPELLDEDLDLESLEHSNEFEIYDIDEDVLEEELQRSLDEEQLHTADFEEQDDGERLQAVSMMEHGAKPDSSSVLTSVQWVEDSKLEIVMSCGMAFQFNVSQVLNGQQQLSVNLNGVSVRVKSRHGSVMVMVGGIDVVLPTSHLSIAS